MRVDVWTGGRRRNVFPCVQQLPQIAQHFDSYSLLLRCRTYICVCALLCCAPLPYFSLCTLTKTTHHLQ